MDSFEFYLQKQRMSEKTIYEYTRAISRFISWYEDEKGRAYSIHELSESDPGKYADYLRYTRKLSARYINKNLTGLRKYLSYLQNFGIWKHNINLPDVKVQNKSIAPKWREPYEISAILRAIELEKNSFLRSRDRAMLFLELYLGIRIGEIMDLNMNDVILSPGQQKIIIRDGKGGKYDEIHIQNSRKVLGAINDWLHERSMSKYAASDNFFVSFRSDKVTTGAVHKMVLRIRERSHIDDFNTHDLRHTFVNDYLKESKDIRLTMDAARHSDIKTTLLYTQPSAKEVAEFYKRIEEKY